MVGVFSLPPMAINVMSRLLEQTITQHTSTAAQTVTSERTIKVSQPSKNLSYNNLEDRNDSRVVVLAM